jgi:gluconate 2-dehydrogenase gamma chain
LLGSAAFLLIGGAAGARAQWLPWRPEAGSPPEPFVKGPWIFFDPAEGAAVEALGSLIPPDPETPGGKDAGCAVFIDRQLAGPFGRRAGLYLSPPFIKGTKQQGPQDEDGPAVRYRKALAALDQYCKKEKGGAFVSLSDADKDAVIGGLESGASWTGVDGQAFFQLLLANTRRDFRRSDLRRESRCVRVGHDQLERPGYDSPRLGVTVTTSAIPIRRLRGGRIGTPARPEGKPYGQKLPKQNVVIIGPAGRFNPRAELTDEVSTSSRSNGGRGATPTDFPTTCVRTNCANRIRHEPSRAPSR